MLAAMPQPPSAVSRDEPVIRDRGDACPGALRLHAADDGYLARVRIPGGALTAHQASLLASAADRFGDGHLELTSRGNVQLRGLVDGCGAGLAELLDAAGLLPAPAHERVRNIVATPTSQDVLPWVRELDRLLCANTRVTALSGRFLFALDDGRGDVAALEPDVTVLGRPGDQALVRLGAAAGAVAVAAREAPRAALLAAEYFLDAVDAAGTRAWRVAELPAGHALDDDGFASRLAAAGIDAVRVPAVNWPYCAPPLPGPHDPLCVLPPFGRLSTDQWRVLVQVAEHGDGLRITPWRTVVLPGATDPALPADAGLVVSPDSPWLSVTACTGRPGCAKSLADVRADARALVDRTRGPLPVHWSGCERRCGHPRGTQWVDALATADGYRLSVHGRTLPNRPDLAAALTAARENTSSPQSPKTQ
ncbi:cobalamin biosynthesis protein CobG [Streptomyces sp. MMS21 TC-5]|uniref:cobalamin biosynthesis protein CobG n=1 Tax=Streptomyces sp. MMS21 TC-5 TaxID=2925833 RepID=UPI001F61A7B7|nr:cobalamin biosynthesis protein CobG [Streptomyces sp. MMS21 TC-5]MCI4084529.1 cobalamin biosynthesis protein CobG [Streptomyces sp. MMS21 TC-5]